MARIAGVNIPDNKRIVIALTYIYGLGKFSTNKILKELKISPDIKTRDLDPREINQLREVIEKRYKIEGDLRRQIQMNIKRLKDIGCYRGMRHKRKLPARGQRTKTNARTLRGVRRTMGSGRRKSSEKT